MKGTVIKRGKKWSVVVDGGRDVNGKRIRKWHSGFETKREAEQARIEILGRMQAGTYVEPNRLRLGGFLLQEWLPATRSTVAATTFESRKVWCEAYIVPALAAYRPPKDFL